MWADFSAWLLVVGVIIGVLAAIAGLIDFLGNRLIRAQPPAWPHLLGNVVVLVLAFFNVLDPHARRLDLGGADRAHPFGDRRADPAGHRLARLGAGLSPRRGSCAMMSLYCPRAVVLCAAVRSPRCLAGCNDGSGDPKAQIGANPNLPDIAAISAAADAHRHAWSAGRQDETPTVAQGLKIKALATGLQHPRSLYVLPNGDVLVVESKAPKARRDQAAQGNRHGLDRVLGDVRRRYRRRATASPCCATPTATACRITQSVFLDHLNSPFGVALVGNDLYVANTDAIVRYPYTDGRHQDHRARHDADAAAGRADRPSLDQEPGRQPRRHEALCRRRLQQQHHRERHGGREEPRRHPGGRPRHRRAAASSPAACAIRTA